MIDTTIPPGGIFMTGIENSDPWVDGKRRDQLAEAQDFYSNYESRIKNIHSLGIRWLRFGLPYSKAHLAPGVYDFSLLDKVSELCISLEITIVIDLLHFGLPEWMHSACPDTPFFQNPQFPYYFAEYAKALTERYPHFRFFTLINEPYVTASFSAKLGLWNEQLSNSWEDDSKFIIAAKNIACAAILARIEIEKVFQAQNRGNPIFMQNESFEIAISEHESRFNEAQRFNLRRFALLDLILGHKDDTMKEYLINQGLKEEDYAWFIINGSNRNTILGIDHYKTCVHFYLDKKNEDGGERSDHLAILIKEYFQRYNLPLIHMEANAWPHDAVNVCNKTFGDINKLRSEGYPILGMSWFGDELQVGWHHLLKGPKSYEESPVGLFYKGKVQEVGLLFSELIKKQLIVIPLIKS